MSEKIDMENSVIMQTLPSGDLYRVRGSKQRRDRLAALPKLNPGRKRGAGSMECEVCGMAFLSTSAKRDHMQEAHNPANTAVMLPDGSSVPLSMLIDEYRASQERVAEKQG